MHRFYDVCSIWLLLLSTVSLFAQTFPPEFSRQLVSGGVTTPTTIAFAPDGRIFVTQQTGQLRIIKDGLLLSTPFVSLVVDGSGERGLIGMALDPDFTTNQYIYLYYTVPDSPPHNRLSRFTAFGDVVMEGSETILLELDPLTSATNHNGGALTFGNDGMLYIGVGDNAKPANAQSLVTYHGKILRINSDGSIPNDNPFIAGGIHAKRIWVLGVRNPFSLSVNRTNGKIFVNDVGANSWEEINDVTVGGKNFGWPDDEGNSTNPEFTNPVYTYPHGTGEGVGCALTGGTFFYPLVTNYPAIYYGKYFFQDYCEKWINLIDTEENPTTANSFATGVANLPLYITTGNDGNLYYLSRAASVYKIVYNGDSPPFITEQPEAVESQEGSSAFFDVGTIGSLPLTYQWQKDGANIVGATEEFFSINEVNPSDAGSYSVTVANVAGDVTSEAAQLTVIPVLGTISESVENQIVIFPNPTRDGAAVLQLYSKLNEHASLVILDSQSKTKEQISLSLIAGLNKIDLPIAGLQKGVYLISLRTFNRKLFWKLIVI